MNYIDIKVYKYILFFILIPLSIVIAIRILNCFLNKKYNNYKKTLKILKSLGILFTTYFIYTLCLSINKLILLKKYRGFSDTKIGIILWIILPIIPCIITIFTWNKYKEIKGVQNENRKEYN